MKLATSRQTAQQVTFDEDSPATSLLETKIHLNSVISNAKHGTCYMLLDLKEYSLATPMAQHQFYKLSQKVTTIGFVYII